MLPVVALIGRPNVGKSTLFNAMTGTRDALVADFPGLTRDRQYGYVRRTDVPCIVVDTGGLVENAGQIESLMIEQTEQAIAEADRLVVVVDGRAGVTPQDQFTADLARRSGKPVVLAVNKTEGFDPDSAVADFHQLGLGEPLPVAAAHDQGVVSLLETVLEGLAQGPEGPRECRQEHAHQPPARRESHGGLRPAGDDARCRHGALRARRRALHADRYG